MNTVHFQTLKMDTKVGIYFITAFCVLFTLNMNRASWKNACFYIWLTEIITVLAFEHKELW